MIDVEDVIVWNRRTGREVARLSGHSSDVKAVCAHPTNPLVFYSFDEEIIHAHVIWCGGDGV